MSADRAYRLWRDAKLQVPRKRPRRRIAKRRPRPSPPVERNHVWRSTSSSTGAPMAASDSAQLVVAYRMPSPRPSIPRAGSRSPSAREAIRDPMGEDAGADRASPHAPAHENGGLRVPHQDRRGGSDHAHPRDPPRGAPRSARWASARVRREAREPSSRAAAVVGERIATLRASRIVDVKRALGHVLFWEELMALENR